MTASWVVAQKGAAEQVDDGEERKKQLKGEKRASLVELDFLLPPQAFIIQFSICLQCCAC